MVLRVIAVGGPMASGKSRLVDDLKSAIPGAVVRAYGDVVRGETAWRGLPTTRSNLQRVGQELVDEGWDRFVSILLEALGRADVLIIDGVRHVEAFEALTRKFPDATSTLVYLDPPLDVLDARGAERGEDPRDRRHQVEQHLPAVRDRADVIVGGTRPEEDLDKVLRALDLR